MSEKTIHKKKLLSSARRPGSRKRAAEKRNALRESVIESNYSNFRGLEKPLDIAEYFGFIPLKTPLLERQDLNRGKPLADCSEKNFCSVPDGEELSIFPEERLAILRTYIEKNMCSWHQPVMVFYKRPARKCQREFSLDLLGSGRSVLEATAIKAALTILEEHGFGNLSVEINSIGDRESFSKFERQLSTFYRKNIEEIAPLCKEDFKKDHFGAFACEEEKCYPFVESSPKPINFLSDQSREHFREVLEHLETFSAPYRINDNLIGNKDFCSHTVFQILGNPENEPSEAKPEILALGMRYNGLAKKMGLKKDIPGVGISVTLAKAKSPEKIACKPKKPKFFLIQLGFEAKLKSLHVIDILRRSKVSIHHALTKDKLAAQLPLAESLGVPYIMIMGQKEALENSVVVRNLATRSQDTIRMDELGEYARRLK